VYKRKNATVLADEPGVIGSFGPSRQSGTHVWYTWHMPSA
jgi:hypothetical protein